MRSIRAARLAIFNGQPEVATQMVQDAQKEMKTAEGMNPTHAITDKKAPTEGDAYLPFDLSLGLAEGFKPKPDKQQLLDKANEHIATGDTKKAVDELKLANIDVAISAALVPVKAGVAHLDDAAKLIGEKKYYEANLALKAVDDSVIIESYSADGVSEQG